MCGKTPNKAYLQSAVYWNSLSTTKAHKLLMMMVVNDSFIVTCEQPSCSLRNNPHLRTNFGRARTSTTYELRPHTNFACAWSCAALISCAVQRYIFSLIFLSYPLLFSLAQTRTIILSSTATPPTPWNIYTS